MPGAYQKHERGPWRIPVNTVDEWIAANKARKRKRRLTWAGLSATILLVVGLIGGMAEWDLAYQQLQQWGVVSNYKKASEDENPQTGIKLLLQNIENFLQRENIKYIDCLGKTFDHTIHHAISTIDTNDCEEDTIIEEIKKGYFIEDKLLRPSQVIVKKKKENIED